MMKFCKLDYLVMITLKIPNSHGAHRRGYVRLLRYTHYYATPLFPLFQRGGYIGVGRSFLVGCMELRSIRG